MFDENTELRTLTYIANLWLSLRNIGHEIGISYNYVQKIQKKHKMHPYKVDLVQHLWTGDSTRKLKFIAWFNT